MLVNSLSVINFPAATFLPTKVMPGLPRSVHISNLANTSPLGVVTVSVTFDFICSSASSLVSKRAVLCLGEVAAP